MLTWKQIDCKDPYVCRFISNRSVFYYEYLAFSKWVKENCTYHVALQFATQLTSSYLEVFFVDKGDAALFKLQWDGSSSSEPDMWELYLKDKDLN